MQIEWVKSVRSIIALLVVFSWCFGFACGHVGTDAFGITVGAVITFYFIGKKRKEDNNNRNTGAPHTNG